MWTSRPLCPVRRQRGRRRQRLHRHGAGVPRGMFHLHHLPRASPGATLLRPRQEELLRELLHCKPTRGIHLWAAPMDSRVSPGLLRFLSPPSAKGTLERCSKCSKPILDRILRAMGKAYHPRCFTCVVCNCCLDGVPFTVDATSQIHCIDDFHR